MTNLLIKSIERYAPRTTSASWLVSPAMLRTRKAAVAPSQPTEKLTWAVIVNLRRTGVIARPSFLILCLVLGEGVRRVTRGPANGGSCFSAQQSRMTVDKVRGPSQELGDSGELVGIEILQHGGDVFS